ncbi:MAG: phosphotransferase [Candidatus Latescibacteria bacterium]|nr:phosphotransferase [Candidatus Latescibacterota bacterium]
MSDSDTSKPGTTDQGAEFPERFRRYATGGFGERGKVWLKELPGILERCCAKWNLTLGPATDEIKGNYIAYVQTADGQDLVLKVGVPHRDFTTEMEALAIYAGRGINRLVEVDGQLNAMLLERLKPGTMLATAEMDRSEQFEIAAQIARQLHQTPPPSTHGLPHFNDWVESALRDARDCGDIRRSHPYLEQFPRVQSIMARLLRPEEPQILLHGDLHHWNILLDGERGWMAIDPKGVIGASCLDVGRFIGNAMGFGGSVSERREILLGAIRGFSTALGESEERMLAGAFCDRVTGCAWGLKGEEDEGEAEARETLAMVVEIASAINIERL